MLIKNIDYSTKTQPFKGGFAVTVDNSLRARMSRCWNKLKETIVDIFSKAKEDPRATTQRKLWAKFRKENPEELTPELIRKAYQKPQPKASWKL